MKTVTSRASSVSNSDSDLLTVGKMIKCECAIIIQAKVEKTLSKVKTNGLYRTELNYV